VKEKERYIEMEKGKRI